MDITRIVANSISNERCTTVVMPFLSDYLELIWGPLSVMNLILIHFLLWNLRAFQYAEKSMYLYSFDKQRNIYGKPM